MAKEIRVDNLVKLYTLLLLQGSPKHGYEIIRTISEKLGRNASPGQIYPFLGKLKKSGYLQIKKSGAREKKVYALTHKGREFSKALIEKFGAMMELAIAKKLQQCAHCGCEIYRGEHKERVRGKMLIFCCKSCAKAYRK